MGDTMSALVGVKRSNFLMFGVLWKIASRHNPPLEVDSSPGEYFLELHTDAINEVMERRLSLPHSA
jgi:hypothetical protein